MTPKQQPMTTREELVAEQGWSASKNVEGPNGCGYYTAGIDIPNIDIFGKPDTHFSAIEFHSKDKAVALARRDAVLATIAATPPPAAGWDGQFPLSKEALDAFQYGFQSQLRERHRKRFSGERMISAEEAGLNKTIINNWIGGGTLQTWTDGEWQILYAKDSAGNCVTLSLTSHDAVRLAYAVSPVPNEQFERLREANSAVYELGYPEARSDELRQVADVIDCGGCCGRCGSQSLDRGEFCGFVAAENLRKLAAALELKARIDPSRPDAVGGVREKIAALAHRFWSIHPSRLDDIGLTREQFYAQEMTALFTALSNPPAAVESNASVEARLSILRDHCCKAVYLSASTIPDTHERALLDRVKARIDALFKTALSTVGDEVKKSDGAIYAEVSKRETPPEERAEIERVIDKALQDQAVCEALERRPSDPTADRREIVARIRNDVIEECAKLAETHKGYPTPLSEKIRSLKTEGEK